MAELADLLAELDTWRAHQGTPAEGWPDASFSGAYPGLLLVHRLGQPLADPEAVQSAGRLTLVRAGEKAGRKALGTDRCVFCSVGVAPYWDPPVVLLFGPLEEVTAGRIVAPWDTRGATTGAALSSARSAAMVAQYSLQSPDDQVYMPRHLATCFRSLASFLVGDRPVRLDPAGAFRTVLGAREAQDLTWLHTPEARFDRDLEIDGSALRAVFVDVDALRSTASKRTALVLRRLVEETGGAFRPLQRGVGAVDYRGEVARFMDQWLISGGWA